MARLRAAVYGVCPQPVHTQTCHLSREEEVLSQTTTREDNEKMLGGRAVPILYVTRLRWPCATG